MMKRLTYILLAIALSANAGAQAADKVKTVTLVTNVAYSFNEASQDSVRFILAPEGDTLAVKIYQNDGSSADFLRSQIASIEFWGGGSPVIDDKTNDNRNNAEDLKRNPEGWRLEFPRYYQGADITFEVTHSTADYGITYSLEWDGAKKANRWSCYEMYDGNMEKNAGRSDNFHEDTAIPAKYRTTNADYTGSGYSRGHLCPSADRVCSAEQNQQTFLYSNAQPQEQPHNGGVWNSLENKVRRLWAPNNKTDTLYVVKAATIDDANIKAHTKSGLIVPKYFYMALLYYAKASNTYSAIGIWSPHEANSTTEYITIDELEKRTGIDFFCNLPDATEATVEKTMDRNFWK